MALATALFQKRVWLAARITGSRSLGELFGAHFQSTSIRVYFLVVLFLFAVPFAATLLGSAGELLARASGDAISRAMAIAVLAAFLFLASAIGGWRATVYIVAALSTVTVTLLIFSAVFAWSVFDGLSIFHKGFAVRDGILGDVLPGVIQFYQWHRTGSTGGRAVDHDGRPLLCAGGGRRRAEPVVRISCPHYEKPRRLRLVAGVDHFRTVRRRASAAWSHRGGFTGAERHLIRARGSFCGLRPACRRLRDCHADRDVAHRGRVFHNLRRQHCHYRAFAALCAAWSCAGRGTAHRARRAFGHLWRGGVTCRLLSGCRGSAFDARLAAVCSIVSCLSRPLLVPLDESQRGAGRTHCRQLCSWYLPSRPV